MKTLKNLTFERANEVLGYFDSLDNAAAARREAEKEHGFTERHGAADA